MQKEEIIIKGTKPLEDALNISKELYELKESLDHLGISIVESDFYNKTIAYVQDIAMQYHLVYLDSLHDPPDHPKH